MSQLFVPLDKIQEHKTLNILAVVQRIWPLSRHKRCTRRMVTLIDQSSASVDLVLWNSDADNFSEYSKSRIIYGEGLEYRCYRGAHQLQLTSSSILSFDPVLRCADRLKAWFATQQHNSPVKLKRYNSGTFPPTELIGFFLSRAHNPGQKNDFYVTVKGQLSASFISSRLPRIYEGCRECGKKITSNNRSPPYTCSSCNKEFDTFMWRYRIRAILMDCSAQVEVTIFDEPIERLVGKSAEDFAKFKDNESLCRSTLRSICWRSYLWKLKVSTNNINNSSELSCIVMDFHEIDYNSYLKDLEKKLAGLKALA